MRSSSTAPTGAINPTSSHIIQAAYAQHQTTATVGLVWWYGGKQGSW